MKKAVAVGGCGGGGGGKGGTCTSPTDLLICFPARQHLALMPKPICSPSRTTMDKAAAARRRQLQLPGASSAAGPGKPRGSSPMFRGSKAKQKGEDEEDEPQSPKVTCVGQIKVGRPKKTKAGSAAAKRGKDGVGGARSWITVVEEIERMHGRRKKVGWLETLGIRRDALPFLSGALRSLRHKALCFGSSLHGAVVDSTTDSGEGEDNGDAEEHGGGAGAASVFSKWLMVLEGGQDPLEQDCNEDDDQEEDHHDEGQQGKETDESTNAPPPNALLLMRCRSAPAKGLSMSRRGTGGLLANDVEQENGAADAAPGDVETEEDGEHGEELVFMSTAPGFLKLSLDIAKETWVVGGGDPLARSRSWKR